MRRRALVLVMALAAACTEAIPVQVTGSPGPTERVVAAPATVATALPSTRPSSLPVVLPENEAWSRIRAAIPAAVAVVTPTWLPAAIDRTTVAIEQVDPAGARYQVRYGASAVSLIFELGPVPAISNESGLGTRVRGANAIMRSPYDAYENPRSKLVTWMEGSHTYSVRAGEGISGDDLMRAAWALTSTTPEPSRPYPYKRARLGTCTWPGVSAEEVVRNTLALTASGDADAMNDCFALEMIEQSPDGFGGWARMGPVRDVQVRALGSRGGRSDVSATWIFERPPGGAWGFPQAGQFFTLGIEGDRLRIFELATAIARFPK